MVFCLCRRSSRPLPSWCLWWSAPWDLSTFTSSSLKPKIKHLWTSARALPRSTKSPSPPLAMNWSWSLSLTWTENSKMLLRWRVPSSWTTYTNCGEAGLEYILKVFVVCTYLFNDWDQWNENPCILYIFCMTGIFRNIAVFQFTAIICLCLSLKWNKNISDFMFCLLVSIQLRNPRLLSLFKKR